MTGISPGPGGGFANVDGAFFLSLTSNFVLTDVNTAQKIFNTGQSGNGAFIVAAGLSYGVEAELAFTNTGVTAHTWAFLFGGTATFAAGSLLLFGGQSIAQAAPLAGGLQGYTTSPGSATVFTASSTSATENVSLFLSGRININAGGTLIPQIQLSAATTGTETALAGNLFRIWPLGPTSVTQAGATS